jgi:hypothetical protein
MVGGESAVAGAGSAATFKPSASAKPQYLRRMMVVPPETSPTRACHSPWLIPDRARISL